MSVLKPLRGLFFENNSPYLSVGRLAFWVWFGVCVHSVINMGDIGTNSLGVLTTLLVYNMGKKGIWAWSNAQIKNNESEK